MIDPTSINLPRFLTGWYGEPEVASRRVPSDHSWLPQPLKDWYELSSQWTMPLITVKRMRSPEEITTEGRKAVFLEDQGEDFWAFDLDNPMDVYEGKLYGDWEKANEDLSEFLIHNALNEAAYGARATRSWDAVPESLLAEILSPMEEVAFGGWRWPSPGGRVFVSDALVANIGPAVEDSAPWGDRPGYAEVQIGSSRPGLLSYLDEIEGIDWLKSGAVD